MEWRRFVTYLWNDPRISMTNNCYITDRSKVLLPVWQIANRLRVIILFSHYY